MYVGTVNCTRIPQFASAHNTQSTRGRGCVVGSRFPFRVADDDSMHKDERRTSGVEPQWSRTFSKESSDRAQVEEVTFDSTGLGKTLGKTDKKENAGGGPRRKLPPTAYFNDGRRLIDFVIAYQPASKGRMRNLEEKAKFRQKFEAAMESEDLELEHEGKERSPDGQEREGDRGG